MDSMARFLLGGVLGAALGFVISQKNLEKALKGAQPAGVPAVPGGVSGAIPTVAEAGYSAAAAPVMAPPAAPAGPALAPTRPTAVPTPPAEPPAWPTPAPVTLAPPAPAAPQVTAVPTPAESAEEAPVAREPAWRISSAPPLAPAPPVERTPPLAAAPPLAPAQPVVSVPERAPEPVSPSASHPSEVIITREFLEEPVPGSGWTSKATPAAYEDGLEDVVPLVSDLVLPYAGPEVESPVTEVRAGLPTVVWPEPVGEAAVEDLPPLAEPVMEEVMEPAVELLEEPVVESPEDLMIIGFPTKVEVVEVEDEVVEPKELVAEIKGPGTEEIESVVESAQFPRPAVEEPADEESAGEGRLLPPEEPQMVVVSDEDDARPRRMEALVETASVEPLVAKSPLVEDVVELPVEELSVEEMQITEVPVEAPVEAEMAVEADTAEAGPAVIDEAPADVARVDDLKSRIEETRRRIRRELEQPFDTETETPEAEPDWTVLPVVPASGAPVEVAAVDMAPADVAPAFVEAEAPVVEPEPREVEVIYPGEPEEPIDYESMKRRIEQTRSRLKAKAFDAMMTGESALLGRDAEGSDRNRGALPSVDTEIDDTIETSLREEED